VVIDALRGLCLVLMTIDHFPHHPLGTFTNQNFGPFGFFTAALGFVFLSGVVAGMVYEKERLSAGTGAMVGRALRRVRALYITQTLVLLALFLAIEVHVHGVERWDLKLFVTAPWEAAALGGALLYEPGYFGILPMYCFLLALTPFVLDQFSRGRLAAVLGASGLLWVVSGLVIRLPANPGGVDFGAFNPIGYQFLFVLGLAFGTRRLDVDRLGPVARKMVIATSAAVALLFFCLRLEYAVGGPLDALVNAASSGFSAVQLGPLRLLDFAAVGVVVYWFSQRTHWADSGSFGTSWLAFVGRHSLPVFAWSILLTYVAVAEIPPQAGVDVRAGAVLLAVGSLTIPAQIHTTLAPLYRHGGAMRAWRLRRPVRVGAPVDE